MSALDHAWLLAHLPHQGTMCLLDRVLQWDGERIRCRAVSHRAPDNPLRAHGQLPAACGIEYAAQAMAAHGALAADAHSAAPRAGYLASVRGVTLFVARLDDAGEELLVEAERISGDARNVLYRFALSSDGRPLLAGRAAVVLDADIAEAAPQ